MFVEVTGKGVFSSSFTEMIWFGASSAKLDQVCSCCILLLMLWFLNQVFIINSSSGVVDVSSAMVTQCGYMVFSNVTFSIQSCSGLKVVRHWQADLGFSAIISFRSRMIHCVCFQAPEFYLCEWCFFFNPILKSLYFNLDFYTTYI